LVATRAMQRAILAWYDAHGRSLPFRGTRDPYAILVSEVMAQQTQIGRVSEAWSTFMTRFPTIDALAAASPADVLRAWQGLGYNRRALNLRRAAQAIVTEHGGAMPVSVESLQRLPGIGPYTARAVAAIAFGTRVGAVDTNVRRVLGRSLVGEADGLGQAELQRLADASVPRQRPADWTHALMDVGSTFCKPVRPDCEACPAQAWCRFAAGAAAGGRVVGPPKRPRAAARSVPFASTTRWLRGRILDRLRAAEGTDWHHLDAPFGDHDESSVANSLRSLAVDGLVELHPDSPLAARLPLADDPPVCGAASPLVSG
jgi:A/G-specific adenine glycosylase